MNVSGRPVGIAWQQFRKDLAQRYGPQEIERARLVIVHDELENRPGTIRVREGGSARLALRIPTMKHMLSAFLPEVTMVSSPVFNVYLILSSGASG